MSCAHERTTSNWITIDDGYDEPYSKWHSETKSLFEDIDLHRFKCTECGEVRYYSGAAKDYYTKGILSPVRGLDK